MKRINIILVFISLSLSAYAGNENRNGWTSIGFNWANQWEKQGGIDATAYMSSIGFQLSTYQFKGGNNFCFYGYSAFLLPQRGTIESNGVKVTVNLRDYYDSIFSIDAILGLGYKKEINKTILFNFGIGPDFRMLYYKNSYMADLSIMLGIGGDMGCKIDLTNRLGVSFGSVIAFDFACNTALEKYNEKFSGWADKYRLFTLQPYICLSLSYNYDENGERQ